MRDVDIVKQITLQKKTALESLGPDSQVIVVAEDLGAPLPSGKKGDIYTYAVPLNKYPPKYASTHKYL